MSNYRQDEARPKFPLGRIFATPGALSLLERLELDANQLLSRHARGDWGDVNASDGASNDIAVREGLRIVSAYLLRPGASTRYVIWVITEADRSFTTLILPEEY